MKDQSSDERESLWRRTPSEAGRAELSARPELELDARLTEALARVPEVPVSSNFTARVLMAIDLEEAGASGRNWHWNWRSLLPRVAVAAAILIFAGLSLQRYEAHAHRLELAKNVAMIAATPPPPSVDVLENLDAIQRMGASAHADGELLAALQ